MKSLIKKFLGNESGATAIEYALIAALISVVAIGVMTQTGTGVKNAFDKVQQALNGTTK